VNRKLMALAARGAAFMHCLPAHRGCEVTPEILDGAQSVVLDQSETECTCRRRFCIRFSAKL